MPQGIAVPRIEQSEAELQRAVDVFAAMPQDTELFPVTPDMRANLAEVQEAGRTLDMGRLCDLVSRNALTGDEKAEVLRAFPALVRVARSILLAKPTLHVGPPAVVPPIKNE